jgi:hypothetical protein
VSEVAEVCGHIGGGEEVGRDGRYAERGVEVPRDARGVQGRSAQLVEGVAAQVGWRTSEHVADPLLSGLGRIGAD